MRKYEAHKFGCVELMMTEKEYKYLLYSLEYTFNALALLAGDEDYKDGSPLCDINRIIEALETGYSFPVENYVEDVENHVDSRIRFDYIRGGK